MTYGRTAAACCSSAPIRSLMSRGGVWLTARLCRKPTSVMVCWYSRSASAAGLPPNRLAYARADIRSDSRATQRISSGRIQPIGTICCSAAVSIFPSRDRAQIPTASITASSGSMIAAYATKKPSPPQNVLPFQMPCITTAAR